MKAPEDRINAHYGVADLSSRILARLAAAGKDVEQLTRDDLALFDEFHAGGRDSTRELAGLAGLADLGLGAAVLDIGCGIGGPARTLAAEFACRVTGIDLSEDFCAAARMLTSKLAMNEQVSYQCADALALPFAPASFDAVWIQNVLMNVENKPQFLSEAVRVLRPGGLFACETILAGPLSGIHYPVFWADAPALNFLHTESEAKDLFASVGLVQRIWHDTTQRSIALQQQRLAINRRERPPMLSLNVIVPVDFAAKVENVLRNNVEGRTRTVLAVYVK